MEAALEITNLTQALMFAASRMQNSPEKFVKAIEDPRIRRDLSAAISDLEDLIEMIDNPVE